MVSPPFMVLAACQACKEMEFGTERTERTEPSHIETFTQRVCLLRAVIL